MIPSRMAKYVHQWTAVIATDMMLLYLRYSAICPATCPLIAQKTKIVPLVGLRRRRAQLLARPFNVSNDARSRISLYEYFSVCHELTARKAVGWQRFCQLAPHNRTLIAYGPRWRNMCLLFLC